MKVGIVEQSLSTSGKKWLFPWSCEDYCGKKKTFVLIFFSLFFCWDVAHWMSIQTYNKENVSIKLFVLPTHCSGLRRRDGSQHKHPFLSNTPIGWSVWEGDRRHPPTVSLSVHGPVWSWVRQDAERMIKNKKKKTTHILALLSHLHFSNLATPHPTFVSSPALQLSMFGQRSDGTAGGLLDVARPGEKERQREEGRWTEEHPEE